LVVRSVTFEDTLGGSDGRQSFSEDFYALNPYPDGRYDIGRFGFNESQMWVLTVGWILVGLSCLVVYLLMRSPWGRVLKAIREDEDAVRSLGKNVYAYKMQSLIIGGVLGCLGGFIYGLGQNSIQPDIFGTDTTFFAYTVLILGGAARVGAPVVGAMIFWVLLSLTDNILNEAIDAGHISASVINNTQVGQFRFMLVGLLLMLLMIFRPQGIFGDRREIALDAR
jgi:branched-chain amino acid transport system permease protein